MKLSNLVPVLMKENTTLRIIIIASMLFHLSLKYLSGPMPTILSTISAKKSQMKI